MIMKDFVEDQYLNDLISSLSISDQTELASEVYSLKSDLAKLAASFESGKKSLVKTLETKLVKKKCKWMDVPTKGRISDFILKGDLEHAQKWTGLCEPARLSLWNFLGSTDWQVGYQVQHNVGNEHF